MTDQTLDPASDAPARGPWREAWEIAKTLAAALLIAAALRTAIFQPFTIPSSSMEPGLVTGDYILTSKATYGLSRASLPFNPPLPEGRLFGREPRRGEVVVFRLPRDPGQTWIKRVIGLPGDRVQVAGGVVRVNGEPIRRAPLGLTRDHDEPWRAVTLARETQGDGRSWLTYDRGREDGDDTGTYVVPAGHYFVMGDNRDNSLDSRWPGYAGVGLLPASNIVGKAELVLVSWKEGASLLKPWTWLDLQWGRFFKPIG